MALAAISLSIGSSTWNTVVALVSGTVDAMATTIAFRHKTIARLTVWNRPAFVRNYFVYVDGCALTSFLFG